MIALPGPDHDLDGLEDKEVTLQEAIDQGFTSKNIKALRNAIQRDPRFPKPVGRRMEQHGRPWVYSGLAISRWKDFLNHRTTVPFHHNVITVDVFALSGQQIFQKH